MKKSIFFALSFFCLAVLMTGMIGCRDISGGGWISSEAGGKAKATFGLEFYCDPQPGLLSNDLANGFITYHDHGVSPTAYGVGKPKTSFAFYAEIVRPDGFGECDPSALYAGYVGTYKPIPESLGLGGDIYVQATDGGVKGLDKKDTLDVRLVGGVYDGYHNSGYLNGGNLTFQ